MELSGLNSCREAYLQLNIVATPRGNCHNCQLLVEKRVLGDSATELIEVPSQRGLSINRAVLERVPSYFESRADTVGATAPIFSANTLAAS
jgi:hypothetical protein